MNRVQLLAMSVPFVASVALADIPPPPWEQTPTGDRWIWWQHDFEQGLSAVVGGARYDIAQPDLPEIEITGGVYDIVGGKLRLNNPDDAPRQFTILLTMDNGYDPMRVKDFWLTIDWSSSAAIDGEITGVTVSTDDPRSRITALDIPPNIDLPGKYTIYATFDPQPDSEFVRFSITVNPHLVVLIDDIKEGSDCIPTPATLSIVGLGLLATLRRTR